MATARRTPHAPQIDPVVLPSLDEGTLDQLESSADLEGLVLTGIDLDELDLSAASVIGCQLSGVSVRDLDLKGTRLTESVLERLDVPVLRGARGGWRDVHVENARIGSAELYETSWQSVRLVGCKLGFINLRGAHLRDVELVGCTVEELDLVQAKAARVRFTDTTIGRLDVQQSTLQHVDLRGADLREIAGTGSLKGVTISPLQLALLAPLLAAEMGMTVAEPVPGL